ncbi:MAG: outer membrane lipid asymmetry maintenance protein MlaD, partial [Eikenella corrodens]|nr:outer membrane lipid asymmetry maintenance protein MlaD [Eikenella corrodens]
EETELKNGDTIEITSSALVLEQLIGKFMTNTVEKNGSTQ